MTERFELDPATCAELGELIIGLPASSLALRWFLKGRGAAGRDGRFVIDSAHVELAPVSIPAEANGDRA